MGDLDGAAQVHKSGGISVSTLIGRQLDRHHALPFPSKTAAQQPAVSHDLSLASVASDIMTRLGEGSGAVRGPAQIHSTIRLDSDGAPRRQTQRATWGGGRRDKKKVHADDATIMWLENQYG